MQGVGGLAAYGAVTYALLTGIVPFSILQILQVPRLPGTKAHLSYLRITMQGCITPIVIASRLPQIWESFKNKSTGQLSFITWFLNFGGSVARIFTTIQEVDDPLGMLFPLLENALLLTSFPLQCSWALLWALR